MTRGTVQERIEILEKSVSALADLPGQMADVRVRLTSVESQVVRLEGRMEDGFSAIRKDLLGFRKETNERFEETNTHTRVLHEKLVSDIRTLYEGRH